MKKILAILLILTTVLCLAGCSTSTADDGKLSIVVTAFPHYDFARQLTKNIENVEIKMLVSPGSEVHTYEPSPSDILAISTCDVFIYTGGESETWVDEILSSSGNDSMKVISFMDLCADSIKMHEKEHNGHSHEYDEHVWTSPSTSIYLAHAIKNILIGIDGENAEIYTENGDEFEKSLREIESDLWNIMNSRMRDEIVVADRFPFYHLAHELGLEYSSAYPGCSHSTEPSAQTISRLANKVREENVKYVFTIEFSNKKIAKSVTEGTDAEILTLHSCHNVTAEEFDSGITYVDLMKNNVAGLRKALCE